jgi:hypothetical protein
VKFDVIGAAISLILCAAFALAAQDTVASNSQRHPTTRLAQASADTTAGSIASLQGIGLTASHKQIIYDSIANEQEQTFSGDLNLSVGSTIPDSLTLTAMPIAVKDQIGLLKDFRFVKLAGDNILIGWSGFFAHGNHTRNPSLHSART